MANPLGSFPANMTGTSDDPNAPVVTSNSGPNAMNPRWAAVEWLVNKDLNGGYIGRDGSGNASLPGFMAASIFNVINGSATAKLTADTSGNLLVNNVQVVAASYVTNAVAAETTRAQGAEAQCEKFANKDQNGGYMGRDGGGSASIPGQLSVGTSLITLQGQIASTSATIGIFPSSLISPAFIVATGGSSCANQLAAFGASAGQTPQLAAVGNDANISVALIAKGNGGVALLQNSGTTIGIFSNINSTLNSNLSLGGNFTILTGATNAVLGADTSGNFYQNGSRLALASSVTAETSRATTAEAACEKFANKNQNNGYVGRDGSGGTSIPGQAAASSFYSANGQAFSALGYFSLYTAQGGQPQFQVRDSGQPAANFLVAESGQSATNPFLGVDGTDTNIGLSLFTKGSGTINLGASTYVNGFVNLSQLRLASGGYTGSLTTDTSGVLSWNGASLTTTTQLAAQINSYLTSLPTSPPAGGGVWNNGGIVSIAS